ncbi:MAG: HepT-like ribonuclease domain-containing protein [Candidatus Gracilibacteria bacterium]
MKGVYKDTPWRDIASMRDLLIHEYFDVSLKQVWVTVKEDLPPLKAVIKEMIKDCKKD